MYAPVMVRACVMVAVLAACGGGSKNAGPAVPSSSSSEPLSNRSPDATHPAAAPVEESQMVAMRRFTAEMCACTTSDCAYAVSDRLTAWAHEWAKKIGDEPHPMSEADEKQATELGNRMMACMQKAMSAGGTSP